MGEGFGFDDVRCWKKAPWFINKQPYGQWATRSVFSNPFWDPATKLSNTSRQKDIYSFTTIQRQVAKVGSIK